MASILHPNTRQPADQLRLKKSVNPLGVFIPTRLKDPVSKEQTILSPDKTVIGAKGKAFRNNNAGGRYIQFHSADSTYLPTSGGYTVIIVMRIFADGTGEGVGPRVGGASISLRATPSYVTGGAVNFDFGGATEGVTRLTASNVYSVGGPTVSFICTTGPRGMEIWKHGKKIASNSANPSRTAGSYPFVAGDCYGGSCSTAEYYLVMPFARQLSAQECREYSRDPWAVFEPIRTFLPSPVAAVGGITGTSTTTNANDAQSAAGTLSAIGTSATTNADDVQVASGTVGAIILEPGRIFTASLPLRTFKAALPIRVHTATLPTRVFKAAI